MSDLRPSGTPVVIGGQERKLLFTISVIDEIQAECNKPLIDAVKGVVEVSAGKRDHESLTDFYKVLAALLDRGSKKHVTLDMIDGLVPPIKFAEVSMAILQAFGISMPDKDEDDDDEEDEDESPNVETGR
jgi:hypothetical protein